MGEMEGNTERRAVDIQIQVSQSTDDKNWKTPYYIIIRYQFLGASVLLETKDNGKRG